MVIAIFIESCFSVMRLVRLSSQLNGVNVGFLGLSSELYVCICNNHFT